MFENLQLSNDELQSIFIQASSFCELNEHGEAFEVCRSGNEQVEYRLREWVEVAAGGDRELFEKRLAYDGLDIKKVRYLLGRRGKVTFGELPQWPHILNQILQKMSSFRQIILKPDLNETYELLNENSPVPFEELLLPFIIVARENITVATQGRYELIASRVRANLERALLKKLSRISARVLIVEFRTFIATQQLWGQHGGGAERKNNSRAMYLQFIEENCEKIWLSIFKEYCVLARLMATSLNQWVENTVEFLNRLQNDLPEIQQVFFNRAFPDEIIDIATDLSDSHHNGRTVISVKFASGERLIYKPKDLSLEMEYFQFIDWINGFGETLPFRCLKILGRNGYGWVEYVDNLECLNETEARCFYQRAGSFLGLVYALNGMDFHFENIIACADQPVPVDLETIYHHVFNNIDKDLDLEDEVESRLRDSVLRTHFLPNPVKVSNHYYDISAIARSSEEESPFEILIWLKINTDAMDYNYTKVKSEPSQNLPRLAGQYLAPDNYVNEVVNGFEKMYKLLSDNKERLLLDEGPLGRIFQHDARFILRSTTFYLSILRRAFHPNFLRDGRDFSIQLDALSRQFLKSRVKPSIWPLIHEEMSAFWQTDVPKFAARGDKNELTLKTGNVIANCFVDDAWKVVQAKLRNLNQGDMNWQIGLIKGSMDARDAKKMTNYSNQEEPENYGLPTMPNQQELLEAAASLARQILQTAIYSERGEPSWLVLKFLPEAEQFALRAIEFDLYNGRCGLALFFAAMEKLLPNSGYGQNAYATLAIVRRWLKKADAKEAESLGIGGLVGIPALAYTLLRSGTLLGDGNLIEEARKTALIIEQKQIKDDRLLDVLGGSAGAILCLLACYQAVGDSQILAKATACGDHLLACREENSSGFSVWPTLGKRHLTGFSHGAAGISYALLKLYQATGEKEYFVAAQMGIDFEDHEFDAAKNNWPDHREYKESSSLEFMTGWCHGAPGIGLARLGGVSIFDSSNIRRDIQAALTTINHCGLLPRDHICCGNAGLIETMLVAGEKLANPESTEDAMQMAAKVLARAKRKGAFGVVFRNGFFNPSLFQGAAGVGYQLLRLASPNEIPSVLLLE